MDHKSRNEVTPPPRIAMERISHRDDSNNTNLVLNSISLEL